MFMTTTRPTSPHYELYYTKALSDSGGHPIKSPVARDSWMTNDIVVVRDGL